MKIKDGVAEKLPVDKVQHMGKKKKKPVTDNCYDFVPADNIDSDVDQLIRYTGLRHQGFDFIIEQIRGTALYQLRYVGRRRTPNDLSIKFADPYEAARYLKSYNIKTNWYNEDKIKK